MELNLNDIFEDIEIEHQPRFPQNCEGNIEDSSTGTKRGLRALPKFLVKQGENEDTRQEMHDGCSILDISWVQQEGIF